MNPSSNVDRSMLEHSVASINPLPPSPTEFEAISSLIESDEELISTLERERARRQRLYHENESKVTLAAACLETVNADLTRAREFHDHMHNYNKEVEIFADFALLEEKYPERTPKHVQGHLDSLDRTRISGVTTSYHDQILKYSHISAQMLKMASSAVQYHREALQEAQSMMKMVQKDLDMISQQIGQLSDAILRKRFRLQAIWRVPDDIWIAIFAFSTGATNEDEPDKGWICDDTNWHGALVISMVCGRWRATVSTCPRLWSNIVILRGKFRKTTISRISHYLDMSQNVSKTLLIDRAYSIEQLDSPKWSLLWKKHSNIGGIVCRLQRRGGNSIVTQLLVGMPTAPKLWLLQASEYMQHTGFVPERNEVCVLILPVSFSRALKHIVTESIDIKWRETWRSRSVPNQLQSLSYDIDCQPMEPTWYIDTFLPHSIPTLTDLRIRPAQISTRYGAPSGNSILPRVKTLHTNLYCLSYYISRRFSLPALEHLAITPGVDITVEQYGVIKSWLSSTRVTSLVCEHMGDVGPLASFILGLRTLCSLELRGAAVSSILLRLSTCCDDGMAHFLPLLERLTVSSYNGDGGPILAFLDKWKGRDQSSPKLPTLDVTIFADECPGLSLDVRKEIISFAQRMDRWERCLS